MVSTYSTTTNDHEPSSGGRSTSSASIRTELAEEFRREHGTLPFFLVFEEDVSLLPRLPFHATRPLRQVAVAILRPAQTEITPRRRRNDDRIGIRHFAG